MNLSERFREFTLINRGDLTLAYRGWDASLERPVFIKVLNPALSADREIRGRFEREAKAVARLDHPHLVRIYEYGYDVQLGLYMVFEWVEGLSLSEYLKDQGTLGDEALIELARQLLSGLSALHAAHIIHRDLKPDNILVQHATGWHDGQKPRYRITDFSLAAWRDAPKLTHHEAIVGTPAYMAPEQAAGATPTPASDLFALGVILYEAATGRNPFVGDTLLATLQNVRDRDVLPDDIPASARPLIAALLQKDPSQRPRTASEAEVLLSPVETDEPRDRSRNFRYLAAAVLVVLVGILLILFPRGTGSERTSSPSATRSTSVRNLVELNGSQPEFRNPSQPQAETPEVREDLSQNMSGIAPTHEVSLQARSTAHDTSISKQTSIPDSTWLTLTTEPWAHVFIADSQVGTTPLQRPLRLSSGTHRLMLRNPAYPPIPLMLELKESHQKLNVRLAERVTLLKAVIEPWGDLYIDGEHAGTTPLAKPLFLPPGRHDLRVTHPQFSPVVREFSAAAGETLVIRADLIQGVVSLQSETRSAQ